MEGLDREEQMEGAANILTIIQPTTVLESSLAWFKTLYIVLYLDSSYLTSSDDWITVNEPSDASKENTLSQISQISTPMESPGPQNILENPKSAEKKEFLFRLRCGRFQGEHDHPRKFSFKPILPQSDSFLELPWHYD